MPERDYAAPLGQERRETIFRKLRPSSIWGRKPALTTTLRENFPDLSRSPSPSDEIPPVPTIPDAYQIEHRAAGVNEQHRSRTDSARDLQSDTRAGRYYQQPEFRPSSRPSSPQRNRRQVKTGQVAATTNLPPVHSSSLDWPYEGPHAAPSPSARTSPPTYQEHLNSTYRRDRNGRLFQIPNTPHFPTIEQAVRRQLRQPSLRDQASQYNNTQSQGSSSFNASDDTIPRDAAAQSSQRDKVPSGYTNGSPNHRNTQTTITANCNVDISYGGYSCYPSYSPSAEAHPLPPISRSLPQAPSVSSVNPRTQLSLRSFGSRVQATYHPTIAELQATTSGPADTSLSLSDLREAEDVVTPLPVPTAPYTHHSSTNRIESTTSIAASTATLSNRSSASPPLTFMKANIVGFADKVGLRLDHKKSKTERRLWRAKLVKCGKKIEIKAKQLWRTAQPRDRETLRCNLDVLWTGPLGYCRCDVCLAYVGEPSARVRKFHAVPKGIWIHTSLEDYHKLN